MDFLGSIAAVSDPPGIDLDRWRQLIARHPNLAAVPAREGINPFTKGPLTYRTHPGDAHVMVVGVKVGAMTWALDGSNKIAVEGDANLVEPIATAVATELAGAYRRGE